MSRGAVHPDPRIAFWTHPELWPDDTPTHAFLARVLQHIGLLKFGDEWTGQEPATVLDGPLPVRLSTAVNHAELARGCHILYEHDDAYRKRCPPFSFEFGQLPLPSEQEWARVVEIDTELRRKAEVAFRRYSEVCADLATDFASGIIGTATRDFDGGFIFDEPKELWYTEFKLGRFYTCQVDVSKPFCPEAITGGRYIFVDRLSLDAALQSPDQSQPESPASEGTPYFSSYIRCMASVSVAMKLTPNDKRKKSELMDEIPKHWKGPGVLSAVDIDKMATFLREPEYKKGRGRSRKDGSP